MRSLIVAASAASLFLLVSCAADAFRDKDGLPLLMKAAFSCDKARAERILAMRGADVNAADANGNTALHAAASRNDTAMIALLLEKGAEIDASGSHGRTPLMDAARLGKHKALKLLLAKGANVNARDRNNRTALMHMAMSRNAAPGLAVPLFTDGALLEQFDNSGKCAAMYAVEAGNTDFAFALAKRVPDLEKKPVLMLLVMRSAVQSGNVKVVKFLIEKKVPLKWEKSILVDGLERLNIDGLYKRLTINGILDKGRTPLMWAAMAGNLELVKLLIAKGSDPRQRDETSATAYDLATDRNVISFLRKYRK